MRLLDRYLLREFLVPLAYCLTGFLTFWIAFNLFDDLRSLQESNLGAGDIVMYYALRIPEFLPIALPVGLLLALLYTLTNHARHNEITAIRAAGVSLARLCIPYFVVGFAASLSLFAMNEFIAPTTEQMAEQVRTSRAQRTKPQDRHVVRKQAFENKPQNRFWQMAAYNMKTGEMLAPQVDWETNGMRRQVFAERGIYTNNGWTFFEVRELRELRQAGAASFPERLPERDVVAFPEFTETPEEIASKIKVSQQFAVQSRTHRADLPISVILNYLRLDPNPERAMAAWLRTKLHGRFAGPFTCLVVVVIAIPFAAASGRRNVFVGVAASVVIFFFYYMLQQLGFAFGEAGRVPAWLGAWLPNLAFAVGGLVMTAKVR